MKLYKIIEEAVAHEQAIGHCGNLQIAMAQVCLSQYSGAREVEK